MLHAILVNTSTGNKSQHFTTNLTGTIFFGRRGHAELSRTPGQKIQGCHSLQGFARRCSSTCRKG
ncbi:hypothetical protein PVAP13_7NG343100 [Panicum virgatum]|uniref:Uncharacterized protein n=1 Tax=Panicum virgatum TaxID=38727 RepID=A0A8T0Q3N6_PANVG|nr:hypothetical protein PVAP13_7NG343100 [Panicum virgatum]